MREKGWGLEPDEGREKETGMENGASYGATEALAVVSYCTVTAAVDGNSLVGDGGASGKEIGMVAHKTPLIIAYDFQSIS